MSSVLKRSFDLGGGVCGRVYILFLEATDPRLVEIRVGTFASAELHHFPLANSVAL